MPKNAVVTDSMIRISKQIGITDSKTIQHLANQTEMQLRRARLETKGDFPPAVLTALAKSQKDFIDREFGDASDWATWIVPCIEGANDARDDGGGGDGDSEEDYE